MVSVLPFVILALIYQVLSSGKLLWYNSQSYLLIRNFHSEPQESPQTQHILDGLAATFICRTSTLNAYWDIRLPNETRWTIKTYNSDFYNSDGIFTEINSSGGIQTLTLRIIARLNYNTTVVVCKGRDGTGEWSSNPPAKLLVYESLRKF